MRLERLGRVFQRLAVRTGAGPLRPLWAMAHAGVIWAVVIRLTVGLPGCRVFLKGGFGFGRPVYGLSDVDMVVVVPEVGRDHAQRIQERWAKLTRRFPVLNELFNDGEVWVYRPADLRAVRAGSYLTFGLDEHPPSGIRRPAFLGRERPDDPMALLDHPGLYGPQRDWRALGSRRRPPAPIGQADERAIFAWLELRFLWGYAFLACADPSRTSAAYTCQKLISDSARIWLWLRFGEQLFERSAILTRALARMPHEQEALADAIRLGRRLPNRPTPPLAEVLPFLVRTSVGIAEYLDAAAAEAGATRVQLVWNGPEELIVGDAAGTDRRALLPLVDWRARAIPGRLDVGFALRHGDPADPDQIRGALGTSHGSLFTGLRHGELLVFPTSGVWHRGRLRGIECQTSDPVSLALVRGAAVASFPKLRGWSVEDCARRALAEHRGWLALGPLAEGGGLPYWADPLPGPDLAELAGLLGAARAALLADSIAEGTPELALSAASITSRMALAVPSSRGVVEAACGELTEAQLSGAKPDARTVAALRAAVCALSAYRS